MNNKVNIKIKDWDNSEKIIEFLNENLTEEDKKVLSIYNEPHIQINIDDSDKALEIIKKLKLNNKDNIFEVNSILSFADKCTRLVYDENQDE